MVAIDQPHAKFGFFGFILAFVALVIVVIQVSAIFEKPEDPPGRTIGEIAAEIKLSAERALSGEEAPQQPTVSEPQYDLTEIITIVGTVLGALGAVAGAIGLYRHEPKTLSMMAIGFGSGAIVMQYLFWLALLICGALILVSIINNMDSIFDI